MRSTHVDHVPPALRLPAEQRLAVGQAGVVDAHVHALVQRLDGRKHGQDLLLVGQVTLVGDESAAVARALAFCRQLLENTIQYGVNSCERVRKTIFETK